jgi:ribosomal RNA-processing protein 9
MSSFFTLPSSQKKRKRTQPTPNANRTDKRKGSNDNDSISGSDISDDDRVGAEAGSEDDEGEYEDEDPAAKRVRLAEQYLANTQKEVLEDAGFDAAEVDEENLRRRMGERLKEDTAESIGKLYRRIADGLDWRQANRKILRCQSVRKSFTGVAMHDRYIYAVSKDLQVVKWALPSDDDPQKNTRVSKKPKVVARTSGSAKSENSQHHTKSILCVAVSSDGKFVVTGGADKKLIVWDAQTLQPLKVFTQHRDAVTALAFRRGSNQLFSASRDRTVKIWSLNELAYVETLFGHQDEVLDVSALSQEKCVTVGGRDRTARLWKVVEESQLVFRGGSASGTSKALASLRKAYEDDSGVEVQDERVFSEGSIDRIAMIDDDTFVTASDNGSLSLWNIHKKKAVHTLPLAHGLDAPIPIDQASAELELDESLDERGRGGKQPRWITALAAIPFSDVLISGSWDGYVRAWKISADKRRIEPLGASGVVAESVESLLEQEGLTSDSLSKSAFEAIQLDDADKGRIHGVVNDLSIIDKNKNTVLVAAAVGKEHRLGRWKEDVNGRNYVVLYEVGPTIHDDTTNDSMSGQDSPSNNDEGFEGFD